MDKQIISPFICRCFEQGQPVDATIYNYNMYYSTKYTTIIPDNGIPLYNTVLVIGLIHIEHFLPRCTVRERNSFWSNPRLSFCAHSNELRDAGLRPRIRAPSRFSFIIGFSQLVLGEGLPLNLPCTPSCGHLSAPV